MEEKEESGNEGSIQKEETKTLTEKEKEPRNILDDGHHTESQTSK